MSQNTEIPLETEESDHLDADSPAVPDTDGAVEVAPFILYKDGAEYAQEFDHLLFWVNMLLVPVYGRETSSSAPWCPQWWEHTEAVAQLHGLWMAWQELTSATAPLTGPALWHRDFLAPVMMTLRDPAGPFAGCKLGKHRPKEAPHIDHPDHG